MKKTTHKRKKAKNKQNNYLKYIIPATIFLLLLITIILNLRSSGRAVYYQGQPILETVDLTTEKELIFQVQPDYTSLKINVTIGKNIYDVYNFTLIKNTFDIRNSQNTLIAREEISKESILYLDEFDETPDLRVSLIDNKLILRDLHHVEPATSIIELRNKSNNIQPLLIKLNEGETFNGKIIATSKTGSPNLKVNLGNFTTNFNKSNNLTYANYSFTAPNESTALVLDINANVGGKITHGYYTFAIGNVIYALNKLNYPKMILKNDVLTINLLPTTALQPFAIPCDIGDENDQSKLNELLKDPNFKRIYSYDSNGKTVEIWNQGAPSNIFQLKAFDGYFIELNSNAKTTLTFSGCIPKNFYPESSIPALNKPKQSFEFKPKWQLFSIPGLVPQSLADFNFDTNKIVLFSCSQNYVCEKISTDSQLNPGQPYWVYNKEDTMLSFNYVLE